MFLRVRVRLMLVNLVVMAALIVVIGVAVRVVMDRTLTDGQARMLTQETHHAIGDLEHMPLASWQHKYRAYSNGDFFVLWDRSGALTFDPSSIGAATLRPAAQAALRGRESTSTATLANGSQVLVVSQPLGEHGVVTGVVQVGCSLAGVRAMEDQTLTAMAIVGGLALLLILPASWFLAGRSLVPIRSALDRQRRFTADASHELRTPLAVVDAGLQLLRRHPEQTLAQNEELVRSMSDHAARMGRLVAGLLTLARVDSGEAELEPREVDVDALTRSAIAGLEPLAAGKGAEIRLLEADAGRVVVDPDRLTQLLVVLLDNCLRHAGPAPRVEVRCLRAGPDLVLEVADRGPGIAAGERERVFERFHRGDPSRSGAGSGLGLPIARWIATAHGGSIVLLDNRPGVRARVTIPPARPRGAWRGVRWPRRREIR